MRLRAVRGGRCAHAGFEVGYIDPDAGESRAPLAEVAAVAFEGFTLVIVSIVSIAVITAGMAWHWFDSDFGKSILQVVVGPVIGALAAVVGYLFAERKRG
ncbi:hypothetical protein AB0F91_45930 [Amycolatopsis sp. NPDC023774]|uniref:hypothetical protein n=1 Tax=Amycolatopsis sp. NPDC023774 TaxID=3155015 RepID=UPI0033C553E5